MVQSEVVKWEVDGKKDTSINERAEDMRDSVEGRYRQCIGACFWPHAPLHRIQLS